MALFDQTSFAKFLMVGRDAEAALSWLCANDVAKPPGAWSTRSCSTPKAASRATSRRPPHSDRFYLVTGTGFATHDFDWITRHIPAGLDAHLIDGTSAHAVLSLFGPLARDVLGAVTSEPIDNAAFPFGAWRRLRVAGAPLMALRVTYVGELGWELHVPVEFAATVYDALMAAGQPHGIASAGYRAIESLRLEKGYRAWVPTSAPTTRHWWRAWAGR